MVGLFDNVVKFNYVYLVFYAKILNMWPFFNYMFLNLIFLPLHKESNPNSLGLARPQVEISNKKVQSSSWTEQHEELQGYRIIMMVEVAENIFNHIIF